MLLYKIHFVLLFGKDTKKGQEKVSCPLDILNDVHHFIQHFRLLLLQL